jgi:hypothetical protein
MIAAKLIPVYCALYLQDIESAAGKKALTVLPELVIFGLLVAILISIEIGYRTGLRRRARSPELNTGESKAIETAVFGLMGLLIAFIFAGAAVRFDNRKMLIAQEANAIETAYLRLDLLPEQSQFELRKDFRDYLIGRLAVTHDIPVMSAVNADLQRSSVLQHKIWAEGVQAVQGSSNATQMLMLSALNEMIDITTVRTIGIITHLPFEIVLLLAVTILLASFLTGYSMSAFRKRDWLSTILFALAVSAATYVTLDYEYPRVGFIRTDSADRVLIETLDRMQ